VPVCWLASELRSVNSLVPVCWLATNRLEQELPTDLSSEANQQTGTRALPTDLISEANQQTGTRELTDLSEEANQQTGEPLI
jgi:hypothetical protein